MFRKFKKFAMYVFGGYPEDGSRCRRLPRFLQFGPPLFDRGFFVLPAGPRRKPIAARNSAIGRDYEGLSLSPVGRTALSGALPQRASALKL